MTALEVGLVVAVALLAVVVAAQGRALGSAARRLELLERKVGRQQRHGEGRPAASPEPAVTPVASATSPVEAPGPTPGSAAGPGRRPTTGPATAPEGDAVDVRGTDPEGEPTTVPLEATAQPTLLAFFSTTCGICVGLWERLLAGELDSLAPGVVPVVVTKDAGLEDVDRIRQLASAELPVVLSSEAWDDYEVPGSPYVMVVSAAPGSVATEGSVATWDDLVRLARSVTAPGRA